MGTVAASGIYQFKGRDASLMTSRNGRTIADQEPMPQFGFALDDPDSRTRSPQLQVVYA